MKTALITGAAGFLGSHVAHECRDLGLNVIAIDDLSGGYLENLPEGITFYRGSILDKEILNALWNEHRIDYVYHFAAYAAEGLSHYIRAHNYQVNLLGSINLINKSILGKVEAFVFASSAAVYGTNNALLTERIPPAPEDPYGIAKRAVELDLMAAHRIFGLPYIIFRLHNVYGENQNVSDRYRNVVGIFMRQAVGGLPMTIFGDGLQARAFSYVGDVAPVIARAPAVEAAYQEVFNLGGEDETSIMELTTIVSATLGKPHKVVHLPPRLEPQHAKLSHEKSRDVFGAYAPTILPDGIASMTSWLLRTHRYDADPRPTVGIEVADRLPPSWASKS